MNDKPENQDKTELGGDNAAEKRLPANQQAAGWVWGQDQPVAKQQNKESQPQPAQPEQQPAGNTQLAGDEANAAYMANLQTARGGGNPAEASIPCPARYEIVSELGQGGMGVVYKAVDKKLSRTVALKFLLRMSKNDAKDIERFQREATVMAQLHHPNIVAIHDIGEEQGYPFFTMDFIDGVSLRQFLQNPRRDLKLAIRILAQVGHAVHYAHNKGIIHRDLKPSNIMLTRENVPLVMDFGLAKSSDIRDDLSKAGEAMGTPAYMPPEQAEGSAGVDFRADIYALGATLYETLTRRPPFQGETYFNVLTQLLNYDPVPPRKINPDIPAELEAICLKSLEKRRSKRYASAELWAQDLENFLAQRPVRAKLPTWRTHLYKFVLRNKMAVGTALLFFVSIVLGGLLSFIGWKRAEAERQRADANFRQAEELSRKNAAEARRHLLSLANIAVGKSRELGVGKEWDKSGVLAGKVLQMLQGLQLQEEEKSLVQEAETRLRMAHLEHALVWKARGPEPGEKNTASLFSVVTAAFSPDGRTLASGSLDKTIVIREADTGKPQAVLCGLRYGVRTLAFSADGKLLASGGGTPRIEGELCVWDVAAQKMVRQWHSKRECVRSLAFSPDGKAVAFSTDNGVRWWDVESGQVVRDFIEQPAQCFSLAISADGKRLAAGAADKCVRVWEVDSGRLEKSLEGHAGYIFAVAFADDGRRLASCSEDKTVRVWDIDSGQTIHELRGHDSYVAAVSFSPHGDLLASGSEDRTIRLWDTQTGRLVRALHGHGDSINCLAFAGDGRRLVSACADNMLRMWNLHVVLPRHENVEKRQKISSLAFTPDGETLAAGCYDRTVYLHDSRTFALRDNLTGHQRSVRAVAISADGKLLASGCADAAVYLWDLATGKALHLLRGHQKEITGLAFDGEGKIVASAGEDKSVILWQAATGNILHRLTDFPTAVNAAAFSPHDGTLACASHNLSLWETATGKLQTKLAERPHGFTALAINSDGSRLAAGAGDGCILMWDMRRRQCIHQWQAHKERISAVVFSPDGRWVVSGSWDNSACVWETATGSALRKFDEQQDFVSALAFTADGARFAIGSWDGKIRLWDFSARNAAEAFALAARAQPQASAERWFDWRAGDTFVLQRLPAKAEHDTNK